MLSSARMWLPGTVLILMSGMFLNRNDPSFCNTANTSCSVWTSIFRSKHGYAPLARCHAYYGQQFVYCHAVTGVPHANPSARHRGGVGGRAVGNPDVIAGLGRGL